MKYVFILVSVFSSITAISQAYLDSIIIPKPFTIVFIDSVKGIGDLYSKSRLYFSEKYNDAKSVIELEDAQAGYVVGKSYLPILLHPFGNEKKNKLLYGTVDYKMKVECKGEKYRLTFYAMYHAGSSYAGGSLDNEHTKKTWLTPPPDVWLRIQRTTVLECRRLAAEFHYYLTQPQTTF